MQPCTQQEGWRWFRFEKMDDIENVGNVIERVVVPAWFAVPTNEVSENSIGGGGGFRREDLTPAVGQQLELHIRSAVLPR